MAAHAIVDVEVTDPALFLGYLSHGSVAIQQYGTKFMVVGVGLEKVESNSQPSLMPITKWGPMEQLKK